MTNLWNVNTLGKTFVLSTTSQQWEELPYHEVDIKRVSANHFFTWAISSDHQIYIYVPARDVPIRCRVVTYENERWNPMHGFSPKLLPTDRPHWSSSDGLTALPLNSFCLPSGNWQWEGEWYVEDNLEGQPLEPEGWTYAIDFPATYGPNKTWNSLVRRRKWVRYRRYASINSWALVPSIHKDPVQEPFIDVSIGGTDIPGGDTDKFSVWAVTILGRVIFRYGVTMNSPEGTGWVPVDTPEKCEVHQISVGPTGLLWALTWEGSILVRFGVTRENSMGRKWLIVDPPSEEKLQQISVGVNVVWAVTHDKKVWFRKGVKGMTACDVEASAQGSGWIEMVGNMMMVSVGINDQVCALDTDGQTVYVRTGVTPSELCGRTWKAIEAGMKTLRRLPSLSSLDSHSSSSTQKDVGNISDDTSSKGSSHRLRKVSHSSAKSSPILQRISQNSLSNENSVTNVFSTENTAIGDTCSTNTIQDEVERRSICGIDGESYHGDFSSMVWDAAVGGGIGEIAYNLHDEFFWSWISASGCLIDPDALPPWFSESLSLGPSGPGEPWYDDLVSKFKERYIREKQQFHSIPDAIERSVWIKSCTCQCFRNFQWIKCSLEFEQRGVEKVAELGSLNCYTKNEKLPSIDISKVVSVLRHLEKRKWILLIYTRSSLHELDPLKLAFPSEEDLEDWRATLNKSCCSVRSMSMKPEKLSVWSTTISGDVYVHNASASVESDDPCKMPWFLLGGGHLRVVETCPAGVVWGLGYNCAVWVFTYGYGGGPYKGISGSNVSVGAMSDTRCYYIYENQRWNPLTGFTAKGLPTDRYMWSDITGLYECTKENTQLPSSHWQWISDWCIDYKTPGGVDNQGWQYAVDFPRTYHAYKSFTDYVRRRRWVRKCRLLTNGPWKQLGATMLLDVSFQMDFTNEDEEMSVWGVATNGDVLRRVGVTPDCPEGKSWIHIPTEKPFQSISVGIDNAVWGIANDGSAQLRHGISSQSPNGLFWCHVEPPEVGCRLRQISAGKLVVLSVDMNNRLWCRQEIVEIFKEGTHWKMLSENVKQISVGPMDQVWAVMDSYETHVGVLSGVVAHRIGVCEENICGTEWKRGIGGNWNHLCVRACLFQSDT